jgi:hypothetical protein
VPAAQDIEPDTTLTFSSGNGNLISISDDSGAGNELKVTLSVSDGTLTLAQTTDLTFSTGDGADDALMIFTGIQADINAALDGLEYTPTTSWIGTEMLTITTDDQGIPGTSALDADPNIVTKFSFDVDGTDGISSNDATLNNGASITADSERGNVLSVDGFDDYASIPAGMSGGLTQFSFSTWVRTTENGTDSLAHHRPTLFGLETGGVGTGDIGVTTNNGYIGMWTGLEGAADNTDYLSTTTKINDDQWHQITISNDGANVSLYVDGVFEASLVTGNSLDPIGFYIGATHDNTFAAPQDLHSGSFDDFRFFDRSLDAA